jgi:hypothetical protein
MKVLEIARINRMGFSAKLVYGTLCPLPSNGIIRELLRSGVRPLRRRLESGPRRREERWCRRENEKRYCLPTAKYFPMILEGSRGRAPMIGCLSLFHQSNVR